MKRLCMISPLALILCLGVGCQDKGTVAELEEFKAQVTLEEQNKKIIISTYEAWNEVDIEALKEIYSPDYVWHFAGEGTLSLEDLIKDLNWEISAYPDRTFSTEDLISKGDKVISRYVFRGTHEGDSEDFPATRKRVEMEGIIIDRIENGKIVESWDVADLLSLYKQLGRELRPEEE
jgi:predicted ester cyclase